MLFRSVEVFWNCLRGLGRDARVLGGVKLAAIGSATAKALAGHFIDGLTLLRPETSWGSSRFDFYWEAAPSGTALESSPLVKGFVEVKGVTLEQDGLALFPDAPTQRGVKHLRELALCHQAGYQAAVCFVIQMEGMAAFSPNDETHPQFGQALREAAQAGVKVLALECHVAPDSLAITGPIPVQL